VQLSKLSNEGKNELALLVAQRKVVAFRDQDFADLPIKEALDFGEYFGRHHIHPTSGSPEGFSEIHLVHRNASKGEFDNYLRNRNSSVSWHSDVTYEKQPPGTTFLYVFDTPEVGGDTSFANHVEAYNRLSPLLKERLHGLKAVHSGFEQAAFSRERGGVVRREPVQSEHPIVRTHPATGEKGLFINGGCTSSFLGGGSSLTGSSHAQHRRPAQGGERRAARLPEGAHCARHRLPGARAMAAQVSRRLGCELSTSFGAKD
jgi:taurine dioxygenase/sulfonate dioxygenase